MTRFRSVGLDPFVGGLRFLVDIVIAKRRHEVLKPPLLLSHADLFLLLIFLWKGVVVREAVKSAWKSVDQGSFGEMNDWHSKSAMGLDVIGEDEEEEEVGVAQEERWFENSKQT
jgi:hypothetical protein